MRRQDHESIPRRRIIVLLSVAVITAALGFAVGSWVSHGRGTVPTTLVMLPDPREVSEFRLARPDGAGFGLENLRGTWSLLFFGFTNCPDVCPSTLYDLDRMDDFLKRSGQVADGEYQVVFVSVDPERDTPDRLEQYARYFDPGFRGVTGTPAQLAALARQLGLSFRVDAHPDGADTYGVVHSSSVVVVDPRGRLRGAFSPPFEPGAMARDLAALIRNAD